jgi:hypothetical protein
VRLAALFELLVDMTEAGELPGELGARARARFAARMKVLAAKEVAERDYGRAHRAVLVGALRPGGVLIEPEIEAHAAMVSGGYDGRHP